MIAGTDVSDLLDAALTQFEMPAMTVSSAVRRAHRIASLRHDLVNLVWLQWELTDLSAGGKDAKWQDPGVARVKAQLDALLGVEEGRKAARAGFYQWERNRTSHVDGQDMVLAMSISQIELELGSLHATYNEPDPGHLEGDPYGFLGSREGEKAKILSLILQVEPVVERVRSAVYTFLVHTEAEILAGQRSASVFLRAQEYVNGALHHLAPDALQKFTSAQDRLYSGDPEGPSHALTSCRRVIKALADALYPASGATIVGDDGLGRDMSDDKYRNRLLQWVREAIGTHAQTIVMREALASLGARLNSLEALASKGVHDHVTLGEAETCVAQTYLLAADFIRLADGTSALLLDSASRTSAD
jgi:hypothetical protein